MIRRPPRSTLFPYTSSSDLDSRRRHQRQGLGLRHDRFDLSHPKIDRKSTRLNSSHSQISYAVFCLKKKKNNLSRSLNGKLTPTFWANPPPKLTRRDKLSYVHTYRHSTTNCLFCTLPVMG